QTFYWCEGTTIPLTLPPDSADLIFGWSDGFSDRERIISVPGEYPFEVESGNCIFLSRYTVLTNDESECEHNECRISIPNAITPNGDGWNDALEIFLSPECGSVESVTLWDKWGGLRHQTHMPVIEASVCANLPAGIYIVQVTYVNDSGQEMMETSSVLVLR
ncbi:MAG TPA: gliding motility-associated C-terminal domain-containing protein, partial [Sphingobacteriaceae bacterium]|nr:gliding motility-associated C-terminal domain-containing protein [Sphingobacteriaceae bacterium]